MESHKFDWDRIYREESRKVLATLIRLLGDFELAEEALHEAFAAALERWPKEGAPRNRSAWLVSTGRFKAIDSLRRQQRFRELEPELNRRWDEIQDANRRLGAHDVQDDRLRLIFTCCHPALDVKVQLPLTLREVCGLSTPDIARAFLVSEAALAQRLVRGKQKIRRAGIPFSVPQGPQLRERLDSVLKVIYLLFNEGYSASSGELPFKRSLSQEAIRLGRLLVELLSEPEVKGLLALMLLHESRREARLSARGDLVLLPDQDRSLWDRELVEEGDRLLTEAFSSGRFGSYTLQAAISGVHAQALSAEQTDWSQILALYDLLYRLEPNPVVALNRAVAVAQLEGPGAALAAVEALTEDPRLQGYGPLYTARGQWLLQLGHRPAARDCLERAAELAGSEAERRFLEERLAQCRSEESPDV